MISTWDVEVVMSADGEVVMNADAEVVVNEDVEVVMNEASTAALWSDLRLSTPDS
ncbi:hypothetical protein [Streptomyces piniterrae]|uniref:hypothetical protein n=1 Tax=Streptomyces piniterrae TaxID=2571125 RepID=UPI00145C8900|nr:hypothetical protein [Streptomyces piniterrae]